MNETTTTDERTDRRTYLKIAGTGALAAGVAGCLGLGANLSRQNGDTAAEGENGGGASGNGGKGDSDTGASADQPPDNSESAPYGHILSLNGRAVTFYRFKQPETYTFKTSDFGSKGRLVVDVVEVTDDKVATVKFHYEVDGLTYQTTITGAVTDNTWRAKFATSDASSLLLAAAPITVRYYTWTHRQITVGDEWAPKALRGVYKAEITGTDTVAGMKCYTFTMTFGRGKDKHVDKGCMAPSLEMLPQIVSKKDGERQLKMTLVEYEQK